MSKLIVFNNITLDGYFTDANDDVSWAHAGASDPEFDAFIAGNASSNGTLVLGRKTYDLMAGYWPTPLAREQAPEVAEGMRRLRKLVFSRTMSNATWENTTVVRDNLPDAIRSARQESSEGMTILGSGSVVAQLAPEGLIDEYQFVVNPVALGRGRTMFDGVTQPINMRLTRSRTFANGKVLLCYAAVA